MRLKDNRWVVCRPSLPKCFLEQQAAFYLSGSPLPFLSFLLSRYLPFHLGLTLTIFENTVYHNRARSQGDYPTSWLGTRQPKDHTMGLHADNWTREAKDEDRKA